MELITKKEAFKTLQILIEQTLPIPVIKKKAKQSEVIFFTEKDCHVKVSFETTMGGSRGNPPFAINYRIEIYNPFIEKLISELFAQKPGFPIMILRQYDLPVDTDYYNTCYIYEGGNNIKTLEKIAEDIRFYFGDYIKFFTTDYNGVLDVYTQYDFYKNIGWTKFIYGVIFACLLDKESFIEEELVPAVLKSEVSSDFMDFRRSENYKEDIVLPIKKYIEEWRLNQ